MPVTERCRDMTTFTCKVGTFWCQVMPFGAINVRATFQEMMNEVLKNIMSARVYLKDVNIFWQETENHIEQVITISERSLSAGILKTHQM